MRNDILVKKKFDLNIDITRCIYSDRMIIFSTDYYLWFICSTSGLISLSNNTVSNFVNRSRNFLSDKSPKKLYLGRGIGPVPLLALRLSILLIHLYLRVRWNHSIEPPLTQLAVNWARTNPAQASSFFGFSYVEAARVRER